MESSPTGVVLYLGKPNLVKKGPLKEHFKLFEAIDREHVLELLVEHSSSILAVVMDLDSICQVKANWAGTSTTTLGQRFLRQIRENATSKVKIVGVTTLEPLKELLSGAGCDEACLTFDLVNTLVTRHKALEIGSSPN